MVAAGSITRQPHPDAFYGCCFTSSHTKSYTPQRIGLVGGSDLTVVFPAAAPYKWFGHSKFIGGVHPSSVSRVFPAAILHAVGPRIAEKRSDRNASLTDDRVLLRINRVCCNISAIRVDLESNSRDRSRSQRHSNSESHGRTGDTICAAVS